MGTALQPAWEKEILACLLREMQKQQVAQWLQVAIMSKAVLGSQCSVPCFKQHAFQKQLAGVLHVGLVQPH